MSSENQHNNNDSSTGGWLDLLPTQGKGKRDPSYDQYKKTLTALAELEKSLTCFYCQNLFQDPVSAQPCQHCFCTDCVSSARSEATAACVDMQCPICENTTLRGSLENDSFQRNRGLEETVESYRTMQPMLRGLLTKAIGQSTSNKSVKTQDSEKEIKGEKGTKAKTAKAKASTKSQETNSFTSVRSGWDCYFQQLVDFKNENGHTRVRYQHDGDVEFKKFADWVRNQRYLLAKRLEEEGESMAEVYVNRIEKLNSIGFDWSLSSATAVAEPPAPPPPPPQSQSAFKPVATSRKSRTKNSTKWDSMYEKLVDHFKEVGHTTVPTRSDPDTKKLHDWTRNQRYWLGRKRQEGCLTPTTNERIEKLDALNFNWTSKDADSGSQPDAPVTSAKPPRGRAAAHAAKLAQFTKKQPPNAVGANAANLAETLGKVLGALDNLGALENLGAKTGNENGATKSRKRNAETAGLTENENAATTWEKKRLKLDRKLERVNQQLSDAEQNVVRFQGIHDETMASQAKTRMVDLYNKKVELEQELVKLVDESSEEIEKEQNLTDSKTRKLSITTPSRKKSSTEQKRDRLDRKLGIVSKQLADSEKNISRFQAIRDETMVGKAKSRMAKLYNDKVEIENELMNMDDDDDEEGGN